VAVQFKGVESVNMKTSDSAWYPCPLITFIRLLMWKILSFLEVWKFSSGRNAQVTFCREPPIKNEQF